MRNTFKKKFMNKNMEKQKDLISVIVPVYNVEKYLDRCITSIVNQTYQNLEIILVDDESPDNCPAMCDKWEKKDNRIKVIHMANGGSAKARNIALDIAKGEYIAFVDSDDMINSNMLATLYRVAVEQKADIVECDYSIDESIMSNKISEIISITAYDSMMAMSENVKDCLFKQVIWNKLYKAAVIGKIRFVEGKMIDDEFWTYRTIGNAKKLIRIQEKLYFYRQQDGSVMHRKYSVERLAGLEAHVERHKYIEAKYPLISEQSLVQLWFDCRYHGQMAFLNLGDKDREDAFLYLDDIMKRFPLVYNIILKQKETEIVWLFIQKISLKLVCRIRNKLGKGL